MPYLAGKVYGVYNLLTIELLDFYSSSYSEGANTQSKLFESDKTDSLYIKSPNAQLLQDRATLPIGQ